MPWAIAVVLVLLWSLALATSHLRGGAGHVLLGVAVAVVLVRVARGPLDAAAKPHSGTDARSP